MKRIFIILTVLCTGLFSFSQTSYKITWGEEMKLKKGTADLDIIAADNTGLYFTEQRRGKTTFSFCATPSAYKLYKMDKNFAEVFDKVQPTARGHWRRRASGLRWHDARDVHFCQHHPRS